MSDFISGIEASYYKKLSENRVECLLCPHHCTLLSDESGKCKVRLNEKGTLVTEMFGYLSAAHVDPIEKKPLYHFHPGKEILSLGGMGCNFECNCCQNYHISQASKKDYPRLLKMSGNDVIDRAKRTPDNIGVAYTYNEPTVWFEFMLDIANKVKSVGLANVMVSNGYINKKPLMEIIAYMDAFNIDLKCFDSEIHKRFTGGELKFVLNTLKAIRKEKVHLEITHLVVPGVNDRPALFTEMIDWIEQELGPEIPLHISRYFPKYRMHGEATSSELLYDFADIANKKLHYVYMGNMSGNDYQNTKCPGCDALVIKREGFLINPCGMANEGECKYCGKVVAIV